MRLEVPGDPARHAFFLDIDGTLVELVDTPDEARADPWVVEALRGLHETAAGAVAIVSGRPVAVVDRLLAPLHLPVAGQHGVERRDALGALSADALRASQLDALRRCVRTLAADAPELLVEDKGMSLAVHYRRAPALADGVRRALRECLDGGGDAFVLQEGRMVLEIRPSGHDKGTAIRAFMREAPFRGRVPLFVGDDATDEHGFAAVNELGGQSVKVGPGPSAAPWRLADVEAVRRWLAGIVAIPGPLAESS